jgi:hypothetical protein
MKPQSFLVSLAVVHLLPVLAGSMGPVTADAQEIRTEGKPAHLSPLRKLDPRGNLKSRGAFGFPQTLARVLCDNEDLRVSAWSDGRHLCVQAILWRDDSGEWTRMKDGQIRGAGAR